MRRWPSKGRAGRVTSMTSAPAAPPSAGDPRRHVSLVQYLRAGSPVRLAVQGARTAGRHAHRARRARGARWRPRRRPRAQAAPPSLGLRLPPGLGLDDFEEAAAIYRRCRRAGATIRSTTDRLIAAVAIRAGVPLLAADRDFARIAEHTDLVLAKP